MRMHRKSHLDERLARCPNLTMADEDVKNMLAAASLRNLLDFGQVFGNSNPVHMEIGCGKGRFVCTLARRNPDVNYLAVEKISNVIIEACESALQAGLKNVHFLNSAAEVLARYVPEKSVERLYLNFSNPLPKLGYAAQRLTNPRFLNMYAAMLCPGGEIWQKTDNEEFFDYSLQSYSECGFKVEEVCLDLAAHPFEGNVITEHERKFMEEGRKIFRAVVRVNV